MKLWDGIKTMKVTYDLEAKAMYFKFMERGQDGKTEELIPDVVILNKTALGQIAGIEILGVESIEDITNYYFKVTESKKMIEQTIAKPDCYKCSYRHNLPGDANSCCQHPLLGDITIQEAIDKLGIKANYHGIKNGWFNFPSNFDPVWLEECNGFWKVVK